MANIPITFDDFELPAVNSIQVTNAMSAEAFLSGPALAGLRTKQIAASGIIVNRGGGKEGQLAAQKALEDTLVAKGSATFSYPGGDDFLARIVGLEFQEWQGGPVIAYTASFQSDFANVWTTAITITDTTSTVVLSGGGSAITLDPTPALADSYSSVNAVDETPSATLGKTLSLSGVLQGSKSEVDVKMADLKAMLTLAAATSATPLTITTPTAVFSIRVATFSFGIPSGLDRETAVSYTIELETLPDFSLEERSLTGGPLSIAGVDLDVATSFNHQLQRNGSGEITSETMNASGKKFFSSMADANTYRDTVDALLVAKTVITSATGKKLLLTGANWSEPVRDRHDAMGARRYSLGISLSLSIDTESESGGGLSGVVLGVSFVELTSVSNSVSFNEEGEVTSRTRSGSGKIAKGTTPATSAGDAVTDAGFTYYVTSLNLGNVDKTGRRQVSVSGQTIDTALQAETLFPLFFQGFFLDHVDSHNKSRSVNYDQDSKTWKVQSISESVSGFKIGSNGGILSLINTISAFDGTFIITSVSTGAPEKKRVAGVVQERYPISISGTLNVFGANDDEDDDDTPDIDIQTSRSILDPTTKYREVPIPGLGIVDKKIGLNPGEETVTVRHVAKTRAIFNGMAFPADPSSFTGGTKFKRSTNETGTTKSVTVTFKNRRDFAEI